MIRLTLYCSPTISSWIAPLIIVAHSALSMHYSCFFCNLTPKSCDISHIVLSRIPSVRTPLAKAPWTSALIAARRRQDYIQSLGCPEPHMAGHPGLEMAYSVHGATQIATIGLIALTGFAR